MLLWHGVIILEMADTQPMTAAGAVWFHQVR
jgi:hypothetical protein